MNALIQQKTRQAVMYLTGFLLYHYKQNKRADIFSDLSPEFTDLLKLKLADLQNIGGPTGGASTAGKFLEHFTDYP